MPNARSCNNWSINSDSDLFDKSNILESNPSFNITAKEIDTNLPGLTDSEENDSSDSDDTDTGPDRDIDDGTYLVTSVTNLRRRQIFGIEASFEDRRKALSENKRRKESAHCKEYPFDKGKASLEEIQEMVKNTLNEDERNIKKRSPRRSVFSEEKWENTGRWEEVIAEGSKEYGGFNEQVSPFIHQEPNLSIYLNLVFPQVL